MPTIKPAALKWTVEGADEKTGRPMRVDYHARTAGEASDLARSNGILVSDVYHAGSRRPTPPPAPPDPSSLSAPVVCANCQTPIGKLERPMYWANQLVCAPCRLKLEAGERAAGERAAAPPLAQRNSPDGERAAGPLGVISALAACAGMAALVAGSVYGTALIILLGVVLLFAGLFGFVTARLRGGV